MVGECYDTKKNVSASVTLFEFVSTGPKGTIPKAAQFTYQFDDTYNFGFGDWDEKTQKIDDSKLSYNGDAEKVLHTLGNIIRTFTVINWNVSIFVKGNTAVKHRWYQMNINKHLEEIENYFFLWGQVGDQWHPYEKGKKYSAFLAIRQNGGFSF
ncbi:MAG TPA: hypothetical protein VD993_03980 [Chitinophagaceae bacterium]|nr:hypothetical protein [Chitinophagaceae bacterium]